MKPAGLARDGWAARPGARSTRQMPSSRRSSAQRRGAVVHPQVEVRKILGRGQHHGRGLPAAPIAAGRLARLHRHHQPLGHIQRRVGLPGGQRRGDRRFARQHVAGDADPGRRNAAAPFDAVLSGPGRGAAMAIDRMYLPEAAPGIAGQRALDRGVRRQATRQRVQDGGPQIAVGERLGGYRADARADERAGRAHGERLGGDRDGERAGGRIVGDDGPGHAGLPLVADDRSVAALRAMTMYPSSSIRACHPGGTTVVESIASMIAGPGICMPAVSPSRQCTGVDVKPLSANHASRVRVRALAGSARCANTRSGNRPSAVSRKFTSCTRSERFACP